MKLRFSATLGFEYNDNVNLSEDASARPPDPFRASPRDDGTAE